VYALQRSTSRTAGASRATDRDVHCTHPLPAEGRPGSLGM